MTQPTMQAMTRRDTALAVPAHVRDQEAVCGRCHAGASEASHPTGFTPARPLPARFPLGPGGKMTCSTCHDLHSGAIGSLRSTERGQAFCVSCHDATFFEAMRDKGRSLFASGHLDASTRRWSKVDPYSLRCLSCHEDNGPIEALPAALSSNVRQGPSAANHPIGGSYEKAATFGGYRPMHALAEGILLPKGRVGCVSCHVPYAREHGRMPRTRGGLCAECHAV